MCICNYLKIRHLKFIIKIESAFTCRYFIPNLARVIPNLTTNYSVLQEIIHI
jgi:hypothetical protein